MHRHRPPALLRTPRNRLAERIVHLERPPAPSETPASLCRSPSPSRDPASPTSRPGETSHITTSPGTSVQRLHPPPAQHSPAKRLQISHQRICNCLRPAPRHRPAHRMRRSPQHHPHRRAQPLIQPQKRVRPASPANNARARSVPNFLASRSAGCSPCTPSRAISHGCRGTRSAGPSPSSANSYHRSAIGPTSSRQTRPSAPSSRT